MTALAPDAVHEGHGEHPAATLLVESHPPPQATVAAEPRLQPVRSPPPLLLLVEDNPGDVRLVREVLRASPVETRLIVAENGVEALTFLQRERRKPDLILLDLNLPALGGRLVLRRIKSDPTLLHIPVIVLTGSSAPQDVRNSYQFHANCYLVKPTDFLAFERAVHRLIEFWTGIVHLPRP